MLSNPTKRSTYDDQRRAVKRKKQGFGPPPPSGAAPSASECMNRVVIRMLIEVLGAKMAEAPRMRIPKEFMMMPIGTDLSLLNVSE